MGRCSSPTPRVQPDRHRSRHRPRRGPTGGPGGRLSCRLCSARAIQRPLASSPPKVSRPRRSAPPRQHGGRGPIRHRAGPTSPDVLAERIGPGRPGGSPPGQRPPGSAVVSCCAVAPHLASPVAPHVASRPGAPPRPPWRHGPGTVGGRTRPAGGPASLLVVAHREPAGAEQLVGAGVEEVVAHHVGDQLLEVTVACQPRRSRALLGSPTRLATSVGR